MSDRDVHAIEMLSKCNLRPGSVIKKWVTLMNNVAKTTRLATDYQIAETWRLVYDLRSQIKDEDLIKEARNRL